VKRFGVIALLLLAGCGPKSVSAPLTPATPAQASPRAAASTSSSQPATPSPDLKCDLPVEVIAQGEIQGGFLHFPGGAFRHDPRADPLLRAGLPTLAPGGPPLRLRPPDVATYDAAVGRWVPVPQSWISDDGLRYAYADGILPPAPPSPESGPGPVAIGSRVHVVEVQSGDDRVVFSSNGGPFYTIVRFAQDGIYLSAGMPGLDGWKFWRLDVSTRTITKVSDRRGSPWVMSKGVAWAATYEGSNQQGTLPNHLLRLDLTTGLEAIWLSDHGVFELISLDSDGTPIVKTVNLAGVLTLLRVTAPGQTEEIFSGPTNGRFTVGFADRQGTWLAGPEEAGPGIYLYEKASGMRRVSDLRALPLGPCS
jgi:hypothetical protein